MNELEDILNNAPYKDINANYKMQSIEFMEVSFKWTDFNDAELPKLININANNKNYYYRLKQLLTINDNGFINLYELDIYTTFIRQLYNIYTSNPIKLTTTRSQKITPGVMHDDPLIQQNITFNGKWKFGYKPSNSSNYTYNLGSTGVNPVVYAIIRKTQTNNTSYTLVPIMSETNNVTVTKKGASSTVTLPTRRFVFYYDNGDSRSVNALARNTNKVTMSNYGPSYPGAKSKKARLGNNPNITNANFNLKFAEILSSTSGGLENTYCVTNIGVRGSDNYNALRSLVQQYLNIGGTFDISVMAGKGSAYDYRDISKWPNPDSTFWAYWNKGNTSITTLDNIYIEYSFDFTYSANVKYNPYIAGINIKKTDGTILAYSPNPKRYADDYSVSDLKQFYSTFTNGANTDSFDTAIVLQLKSASQQVSGDEVHTVSNSWANIKELLLNSQIVNLVDGLFLGPPITCFTNNYNYETLWDGKTYLTLHMNKDGLPVKDMNFIEYMVEHNNSTSPSGNYTNKFNFLSSYYQNSNALPWWIELYMPKALSGQQFNFIKYLFNEKFNVSSSSITNAVRGLFIYNGTTNLILMNEYDNPKDCIYRLSGPLPFINDTFKQYVSSTINSTNTSYEIQKQNMAFNVANGVLGYLQAGASAAGSALIGNIPGVIQAGMSQMSSITDMIKSGFTMEQQINKIKAHYADKKNISGATVISSLMQDILTQGEWTKFAVPTFVGQKFNPTSETIQSIGEFISLNGFLTNQAIDFASNFNIDGIYLETSPFLISSEGLNKLAADKRFIQQIPLPQFREMVLQFLNRILVIKDINN